MGIMLANGIGIIDNSYCGDGDEWCFPALAMRDGVIKQGERIAQFRYFPVLNPPEIEREESLNAPNRGGFGSTGR